MDDFHPTEEKNNASSVFHFLFICCHGSRTYYISLETETDTYDIAR